MFSRSEKDEATKEAAGSGAQERNPMVLAGLAGLLAVAGAFLLVWYLSNRGDDVAADAEATEQAANVRQVLVVTQTIPRGSSATWISENAPAYLTAKAVPVDFIADSAITALQELDQIGSLTLSADALPGEQLLRGRFVDLAEFDGSSSFLESVAIVDVPDGHQTMVLNMSASDALGGNVRPGDRVSLVGHFRVTPTGQEAVEISVVVFNELEVIQVEGALELAGQASTEVNELGVATQGLLRLTVAVEPDEVTDLAFTMKWAQGMSLAASLQGVNNDDYPRGFTGIREIVGSQGVWVAEADDGNLVDLLGELGAIDGEAVGESIDVEFPEGEPAEDEPAEDEPAEDETAEEEPGES